MGQRSKGVGLHHRCPDPDRLGYSAAAILLTTRGMVELGLKVKK
jgi:hypothetical protein